MRHLAAAVLSFALLACARGGPTACRPRALGLAAVPSEA